MSFLKTLIEEIQTVLAQVNEQSIVETATKLHQHTGRIFVLGEGRSGLMAKAFAMRLMHLGATVFVFGETITPSIEQNDILVSISGSGCTSTVVDRAEKAKSLGCSIIALTTDHDSPLGRVSEHMIVIPASTKYRKSGEFHSTQPLGSLFDQCAHITLDAVCLQFAKYRAESNESAAKRHVNLE